MDEAAEAADAFNEDPDYMNAFAHLERKEQERKNRAFRQATTSLDALEKRDEKRKSIQFQKVKRLSMLAQREEMRLKVAWADVQKEQEEKWKKEGGFVLEAQGQGKVDEEEEARMKREAEERYLAKKAKAAQLKAETEAEAEAADDDGKELQRRESVHASAHAQAIVAAAVTAGGADGESIKSELVEGAEYGEVGWDEEGIGKYGQATSPEDWADEAGGDEDEVDAFQYLELLEEARRKALFEGIRAEQAAARENTDDAKREELAAMLKKTIGIFSDAVVRGLMRQAELEQGDEADDPLKYSHEQWNKFWFRNPNEDMHAPKEIIGSTLGKIQFEKLKEKIMLDMLRKTNQTAVGDRLKFFQQAEKAQGKKNILWTKKGVQRK